MKNTKTGKIHFRGIPCHCEKRWDCTVLTSIGNPAKVTCKNCLRILTKKS